MFSKILVANRGENAIRAFRAARVVTLEAAVGDLVVAGRAVGSIAATTVVAGRAVASIEAMKMEAAFTAPVSGTAGRPAIPATQQVGADDLLVVLQ